MIPNVGRDNSDSLVLTEQAKSLPPKLPLANPTGEAAGGTATAAETVPAAPQDVSAQVLASTGKSSAELLAMLAEAETQGKSFVQQFVAAARERSYRAFRNEHFRDSKYNNTRWKQRSKVFKPKTRSYVRKAQAAAASALFSTSDVVKIEPQDNSNVAQRASAAFKQELLNYRLDRTSGRNAIPWFATAMGAHQDALIAAICVTKQMWLFRERTTGVTRTAAVTGQTSARAAIDIDRPACINIAPENAIWDPNCEWTKPAQTSPYLILRWPLPVGEIIAMMKSAGASETPWLPLSESQILSAGAATPDDTTGTRLARTGGADPVQHAASSSFRPVWIYENYLRIDGEDYTFWTVGTQLLLSLPRPTREVHPWNFGERPVVIGFGAIEAHRSLPMSPVEALQPLQQEANDITNLRLDQMKQVVTPLAKVRRGRQVDIDAVQRRSPDGLLLLNELDDVDWDRPPEVPRSAFEETSILNNDFDDLAGNFSQGSVQSNRSLNETVGGLRLLSGSANALTEFDLRVWAETWVEPVLWQLLKLEEYYEDDELVLALAGQRAELVERFGIDEITDRLLMDDVTVSVSIGLGASDPMQALEKFQAAAGIVAPLLLPFIEAGKIDVIPNVEEIVDEVFGKAGFKNAGRRFFAKLESAPPQPQPGAGAPGPDPAAMAKVALEDKKVTTTAILKREELAVRAHIEDGKLRDRAADRQEKRALAALKAQTDVARERMKAIGNREQQRADHRHVARSSLLSALMSAGEREHSAGIHRENVEHAAKHAPKPEPRANG